MGIGAARAEEGRRPEEPLQQQREALSQLVEHHGREPGRYRNKAARPLVRGRWQLGSGDWPPDSGAGHWNVWERIRGDRMDTGARQDQL